MNSDNTSSNTLATAYALGELTAEERAAFERQMETDPALATLARETKDFCALLDGTLRDPVPSLAEKNRAALLAAAGRRRKSVIWVPWLAGAAAACVAGGLYVNHTVSIPPSPLASDTRAPESLPGGGHTPGEADDGKNHNGVNSASEATPSQVPAALREAVKDLRYADTHIAVAMAASRNSPVSNTLTSGVSSTVAPPVSPAPAGPETAVPVSTGALITIKPDMPKALFAGTPLPDNHPPQNLDKSGRPVLEVKVPAGVTLVSKGRPVTSSDPAPLGDLSLVTDGDKEGDDGYFVDILPGKQWIQIDLGLSTEIHLVWLWHYHKVAAIYKDVVVQISEDPEFKTSTTVFNNDFDNSSGFGIGKDLSWVETNNGRALPVSGVTGRYVRCWSNGRNVDDTNHYIEVEVYGRPPAALPDIQLAASGIQAPRDALLLPPPPPATPPPASEPQSITVRPEMPKPLYAGTPLPYGDTLSSSHSGRTYGSSPTAPAKPASISEGGLLVDSSGVGRGRGAGLGDAYGPRRGSPFYRVSGGLESREEAFDQLNEDPSRGRFSYAKPLNPPVTPGAESYKGMAENPFFPVLKAPLSTFSIDVDTASYSNVRRFLNMGQCPPPDAVRLEELVNYFPYEYPAPVDGKPFAVHVEMTSAPWDETHRIARIALKGKEIPQTERPAANLVFLVDVSGSMQPENKLPLVKQSLKFVVERLTQKDTVSLVTYAGESGVALPATSGADKARILAAIDGLGAGGSTNGAGGISTAYQQASQHFNKEGINRVILATDGDFNVGVTSHEELLKLITEKAKTGVFLSVLGYGMGNTKDDTMELLADKGNGNYAYIDGLSEARKALGEQFSGTLITIAKDVKIQIEFNPAVIRSYRLLGYENRMLAKEDFNNDKKDAGEIGAGHTVTALYELVPVGAPDPLVAVDDLKYQPKPVEPAPPPPPPGIPAAGNGETMTVKLRWKAPDADVSQLMEVPIKDPGAGINAATGETKWAVAVAGFAAMLNGSQFNGLTWEQIRTMAKAGKGTDPNGYRGEFLQLIDRAESVRR